MICKYCEGTGKLGFQQESCWFCGGSGYAKEKIILNKEEIEESLNEIIKNQLEIIKKLNNGYSYTEEECKERLELIRKRNYNDYILGLFNLSKKQYTKVDFGGISVE